MRASGVGYCWVWWGKDMSKKLERLRKWWRMMREKQVDVSDIEEGFAEADEEKASRNETATGNAEQNKEAEEEASFDREYEALISEVRIKSPEAARILKLKTKKERARMDLQWIRENKEVWHSCRRGKVNVEWYDGRFGGPSYVRSGSCGCVRSI